MANFTAADVKRLREQTAAGMLDCKRALDEADGDFDVAVEILRIKGAKDVSKRASRTAGNGLVTAELAGTEAGVLVEVNCETDFVAKTEVFQDVAAQIARAALEHRIADRPTLLGQEVRPGTTVQQLIEEASASLKEKLELGRYTLFEGGYVATYLHKSDPALPPTVGVLVQLDQPAPEVGKEVALQVASMRPQYLTRDEVPANVVDHERGIMEQITRDEGKPEQAVPKIVEGTAQRVLQGCRADRAAVRARAEEDDQAAAQRAGRHRAGLRPVPGGPGRMTASGGQRPASGGMTQTAGAAVGPDVPSAASPHVPSAAGPDLASAADGYRDAEDLGALDSPDTAPAHRRWKRVVVKLSGEAFSGDEPLGISPDVVFHLAKEMAAVVSDGVELAAVVGGGNMFRGRQMAERGIDRARADYMGMLGTVINCLALQDVLEKLGIETRVQTAITMGQVAEPYIPRRAIRHLEKGRVVIFGAGLGAPFFSTDTCAAQRALEIGAEAVLKGTQVDGVYDADPRRSPGATRFTQIDYGEVLRRELKFMDATAVSLCMDNGLPIVVFDLMEEGNVARAVRGEKIGTLICRSGDY